MQNVVTTMGLRSKWLKKNDLIYPCDAVATRHKLYCYLLVSSRILPAVGYDWRRAADWCRRSERGWVGTCFQSYGRDVSGTAQRNPAEIQRLCAMAGSGEKECLYGAVRDILNTNGNDLGARRLCETVKRRFRAYCFFGIGTILGTLYPDKRAACSRFASGADLAECLKGAGS